MQIWSIFRDSLKEEYDLWMVSISMDRITLMHGTGGSLHNLIQNHILKPYMEFEVPLAALDDAGICNGIVFTTDSYT